MIRLPHCPNIKNETKFIVFIEYESWGFGEGYGRVEGAIFCNSLQEAIQIKKVLKSIPYNKDGYCEIYNCSLPNEIRGQIDQGDPEGIYKTDFPIYQRTIKFKAVKNE